MPTIINESSSEFKRGMRVEQEHKDITKGKKAITKKIVVAHLKEHKNYYSKLKKAGIE
jgi:hypothetical protein